MKKNNRWLLIISSIVILLPMVVGIIFWDKLPELMPVHWGIDGHVDGMGGRGMVVFGIPLIMLVLQLLCVFFTSRDPGNKHQSNKVFASVYWIIPSITLMITGVMYLVATGREVNVSSWICGLLGIFMLIMGNYIPKYRRNCTLGIKIKWTLESEENWNATHRFAGKIWVICGFVLLACIPFQESVFIAVGLATIIVMIVVPYVYSWRFHRKQLAEGFTPDKPTIELKKWQKVLSGVMIVGILLFCVLICFTGNINVLFNETTFTIEASYYTDITVEYAAIDSVEYRDTFDEGTRTSGFGSPRLSMGTFQNEEFGYYTIYAYNSSEPCVVIESAGKILVLRGRDETATEQLYEELVNH